MFCYFSPWVEQEEALWCTQSIVLYNATNPDPSELRTADPMAKRGDARNKAGSHMWWRYRSELSKLVASMTKLIKNFNMPHRNNVKRAWSLGTVPAHSRSLTYLNFFCFLMQGRETLKVMLWFYMATWFLSGIVFVDASSHLSPLVCIWSNPSVREPYLVWLWP